MNKILRYTVFTFLSFLTVASTALATGGLPTFSNLVKEASPAVVNISTERVVKSNSFRGGFPGMPPDMERFFEQFGPFFGGPQGGGKDRLQNALGTGFIISPDGYIVTNNHVVEGADKIFVNLEGKGSKASSVEAKLIGMDPETDIALLKVKINEKLPTLKFGDSDTLEVGEWVLAIGNPFGLSSTVTAGILSAKGRDIHAGPFDNFLQTEASINPGNSGGPLINMQGEVIGINTAIAASGQGIGFAIPSNLVSSIVEQLKTGQRVSRGWIGVSIQNLDEMTAQALGTKDTGALIASVMPNEPADKAGLRSGDIVVKVGNTKIENASDLTRSIASYKPNSKVKVTVIRDGKEKVFTVTLGERNTGLQISSSSSQIEEGVTLGVTLRSLNDNDRQALQLGSKTPGLVILEVQQNSRAARVGLRAQDVILAANLKPVGTATELSKIIDTEGKKRGAVVLQVYRQGNIFIITVPLTEEKSK